MPQKLRKMDINDLLSCPICRNIPDSERDLFFNGLIYSTKHFKKGEWIVRQGDRVNALYILLRGSVKAEMISEAGTVLNIETIHAPNPLAPAFLFSENNRFPVDVVALDDCEVVTVPKEAIMKQLACNESFLKGFMTFSSNRAQFLSERLKFLSTKTIKGKLAQYILARADGIDFTLNMSQTALSDYFGVARPSLSRSLSEMVNDGIISLKGKTGKILNLVKLRELIVK